MTRRLRPYRALLVAMLLLVATLQADDAALIYPVQIDGKWGYIDATGELVVPAVWDAAFDCSEGRCRVRRGELYGFIDTTGKVLIEPAYPEARDFHSGRAAVARTPVFDLDAGDDAALLETDPDVLQWGYIDPAGAWAIPAQFAGAADFQSARAAVRDAKADGLWGYIDTSGKWVSSRRFLAAGPVAPDGVAVVQVDDQGYQLMRADGNLSEIVFDQLGEWQQGLAPAYRLAQVAAAESLADRLFAEQSDELHTDDKANTLKRGNAATAVDEAIGYGYVDSYGTYVIKPQYERAFSFSGGLARVQIERKFGFIDPQGTVVIEPTYDDAQDFHGDLAAVKDRGFWIYIRPTGKRAFDRRFDVAGPFRQGIARVVAFDEVKYIDTTGKTVWPQD